MTTSPCRYAVRASGRIHLLSPLRSVSRWPVFTCSHAVQKSGLSVTLRCLPAPLTRSIHFISKPPYDDEDLSGLPFSNSNPNFRSKPRANRGPSATVGGDIALDDIHMVPIQSRLILNEVTEYFWRCIGWDQSRFRGINRYDFSRSFQYSRCQVNLEDLLIAIALPVARQPTAKIITMLFHYSTKRTMEGGIFSLKSIQDPGEVVSSPTIRNLFATLDRLKEYHKARPLTPERRETTGWEYNFMLPLNFEIVLYFITGLKRRPKNGDPILDRTLADVVEQWRTETLDKHRYTRELARAMREYSIKRLEKKVELVKKSMKQHEDAVKAREAAQLRNTDSPPIEVLGWRAQSDYERARGLETEVVKYKKRQRRRKI
ncbi:hypothetical protein ABW21_db0208832 [Orbilia brochopaga]|nr:hypothetical protein ABW21_db0208832 [Drechslerella brochopaga]